MDILLTDDIIIDYRDADFGIDNSTLEFDVGFENLLGPSVVVVPTSIPSQSTGSGIKDDLCSGGGGPVELPDSPPDSSASPQSSVYSPIDHRQSRKRRRNSENGGQVDGGGILCDLMLGGGGAHNESGLKDDDKNLQAEYPGMMSMNQCPYGTPNDDIKPVTIPMNAHEPYQHLQPPPPPPPGSNYVQLATPVYYNGFLEYEANHNNNSYATEATAQSEDLYSHQHHQQPQQQQQQQHTFVDMPSESHTNSSSLSATNDNQQGGDPQNLLLVSPDHMQRKNRKMNNNNSSFEEASPGTSATPDSQYNSSERGGGMLTGTGGDGGDGSLPGTPMQCIRFEPFQTQQWHPLCDHQLQDLPVPHYRVDADKGFNFSASDEAFVCQKKNHFQVTCHTQLTTATGQVMTPATGGIPSPAAFNVIFVRTQNGLEKVRNFCLHFYGVKYETPRHKIRVEQSQSDRSKKVFHPVVIDLHCGQVSKTTVGRLHFSETTSNNMRKKGRPNPEQRYFRLVVALHAHTHTGDYPIVVHGSEKIIVRASNPGQFENDFELCWQRGVTPDSIFHNGKIGLNTDQPDECLVVNGNLKVTGHILQPSDCRIKRELTELSTKQQLENIEKIRIVKYAYQDGRSGGKELTTGVMAQEVRRVLPDAVFEQQGTYHMPNGGRLDNFLVVNKDRIFLENVGAVKELSKATGKLERRIEQLEICQGEMMAERSKLGWESVKLGNHSIQWIIVVLILVMTVCLSTLATLFFVEHYDAVRARYYESIGAFGRHGEAAMLPDQPFSLGSKHQSMALSHNYSTVNDHFLLPPHGKTGKKSTNYKSVDGGGGQSPMAFPSFTDNRSGTVPVGGHGAGVGGAIGPGNNLGADAMGQLNWSNIEFSFLYIYKLQQYYNELQKKSKGKGAVVPALPPLPPSFGKAKKNVQVPVTSGEVMADSPGGNADEDCDSAEGTVNDNAEDNSATHGVGGDLKLDEELMNRLLANIINAKNQNVTEDPALENTHNIPSDNSAIGENGENLNIPDSSTAVTPGQLHQKKKEEQHQKKRLNESGSAQQQDIENLINSN